MPQLAKVLRVPTPAVRKPGAVWTELPRPVSAGAKPVGHVRLGYARASTARKSFDAQLDSLAEAGVTRVFSEKISTRATRRPELEATVKLAGEIRSSGVAVTFVVHEHKRLGRGIELAMQCGLAHPSHTAHRGDHDMPAVPGNLIHDSVHGLQRLLMPTEHPKIGGGAVAVEPAAPATWTPAQGADARPRPVRERPSLFLRGYPRLQPGRETRPKPGGAKRRSSLRLCRCGQIGRFWPSMYWRITVSGAPPHDPAK
nr:recombinase family protein [Streptomyces sp. NBC_00841]